MTPALAVGGLLLRLSPQLPGRQFASVPLIEVDSLIYKLYVFHTNDPESARPAVAVYR